jgi:hypothetical protein
LLDDRIDGALLDETLEDIARDVIFRWRKG